MPRLRNETDHRLGRALREIAGATSVKIAPDYPGLTQRRGWRFPPLAELRQRWVSLLGEPDELQAEWEHDLDPRRNPELI